MGLASWRTSFMRMVRSASSQATDWRMVGGSRSTTLSCPFPASALNVVASPTCSATEPLCCGHLDTEHDAKSANDDAAALLTMLILRRRKLVRGERVDAPEPKEQP